MTKTLKVILTLNAVLLVAILLSKNVRAQLPPQTNPDGVPFFNVNINPTNIPPMVNIDPYGVIPKVEVSQMPPVAIVPTGCDDRQNFQTDVGKAIAGPMVVTYLNIPPQTQVTLGPQRVMLSNTNQLGTAIYLRAGQQLNFDNDVMYSGCRPQ
jgi:hypothetical protein